MSSRTPYRRFLIEGLVIVVSILLAFGIDAAWDARQESEKLSALIDLMVADLDDEIAEMEWKNARADSIRIRHSAVLELGDPGAVLPPADSLAGLVMASWQASTHGPTLAALSIARGNPVWDRIPEWVQVRLTEYSLGWRPEDRAAANAAYQGLQAAAGDHGGFRVLVPRSEPLSDPRGPDAGRLAGFVRDPHVRSWLWVHAAWTQNEQIWRARWIDCLSDIQAELLAFSQGTSLTSAGNQAELPCESV